MSRIILLFCIALTAATTLQGPGFAFGVKGGLTIGTQQWGNSFDRDALFRYNGIAFIESLPESNDFSIFAQAGYHVKGSSIRTNFFFDGNRQQLITPFEFQNASLIVGGKQKFDIGFGDARIYYLFGIRGDYNLSTDFGITEEDIEKSPFLGRIYPVETFVNNFTYGATVGGGIEFPLNDLVGVMLEFTVNPDFSNQYNQPRIENVINPNPNSNQSITIPERQIRNLTFEISAGFRFLRIVEYID
jgi:hypothetical protein